MIKCDILLIIIVVISDLFVSSIIIVVISDLFVSSTALYDGQ